MSEKTYHIESIDQNGPKEEELSLDKTVEKLNQEKMNNRFIFIDGRPVTEDVITAETVQTCKTSISITNQLIGG